MIRPPLLLDENVERRVANLLREEGFEVERVVDALGPGVEDESDIAPYARSEDRIVVTKHIDFLAMDRADHAGVFFVNDHRKTAHDIASAVVAVAEAYDRREPLRDVVYLDDWC